jgi:hypothetical protein
MDVIRMALQRAVWDIEDWWYRQTADFTGRLWLWVAAFLLLISVGLLAFWLVIR